MKRSLSTHLAAVLFAVSAVLTIVLLHVSKETFREPEERGTSDAMHALDDWTRARAYPGNDVPPDKYYAAYLASKSNIKEVHRSAFGATAGIWTPMGPLDNDSRGRSISVAVNPVNTNTIYCGTASGGLWRSRKASLGGGWQRMTLGFPALGISSILIDPSDTTIMYVGTGEVYRYGGAYGGLILRTTRGSYGVGILKTTNAGVSWAKSLDWTYNQQRGIQQVIMNPLNHNTLYSATTEGIYKSTDQGSTWSQSLNVVMATDVVINSADTTLLLAACGNFNSAGYGIYRSTNSGATWAIVPGGQSTYSGMTKLEVFAGNPYTVYASVADSTTGVGGLWRSRDFGSTWTLINNSAIFGVQGWYSHFVAAHATDSLQLVHAGLSSYKSVNGGTSLTGSAGGYSDNHNYGKDPKHPDVLYIVNDNGIFRSSDFGASFTNIGNGMQTLQFYNGFANSATDSLLAAGQVQDHIPGYRYSGSFAWDRPGNTDEVGWMAIDQTNDNVQYSIDREGGNVYKSTNRGASFSPMISLGGVGGWNTPLVVSQSNSSVLYAGKSVVYKSTTAGTSWAATNGGAVIDGNPGLSMAVSATNPNIVFLGTAPYTTRAHIFRTTNGGALWLNVTGTLPDRYPLDINVNPQNSNTVYATFGGFGAGHVFKSYDLGGTWTDITGTLPDAPAGAILVDPTDSNTVYCGNDIGVYISTDGGASWGGFSEGLPEAVICADLVITKLSNRLRVATHGNGVYERWLGNGQQTFAFDYRPLTLDAPVNGAQIVLGASFDALTASILNSGIAAQTDSFDVMYRILKAGVELFTSEKRIPGLALSEVRQVGFTGTFTPPDTGEYAIQVIMLAGDQDPTNDTLSGAFDVIVPARIAYSKVTKQYCPYTEILTGSPGPSGDDAQLRIALPFLFTFDDYQYDSLQISTNGWAEFGTGPQGSARGLSSPAQIGSIGANNNGRLGTVQRPTKAMGIWWEDMNTDPPGSAITYTTQGSQPNRVFIVQWKNIRAYYDASVTTTLNFQLRLYEASNTVEYRYGPVNAGTFGGSDAGAMIGVKDDVGGDYHYFDVAKGGTGTASEVVTNLSPLTNWPGPDTCIRVQGVATTLLVAHEAGWNMISNPLSMDDDSRCAILTCGGGSTLFSYSTSGGYSQADSLMPGTGYWFKFPAAGGTVFAGSPLPALTVHLSIGWNLFGTVDHDIAAPAGGPLSSVYGYSAANGYDVVSTLSPGKAYWVKSQNPVDIVLGPSMQPAASHSTTGDDAITFTDGRGRKQTLYLAEDRQGKLNASAFEMPPAVPDGLDVRFASRRAVEIVRGTESQEFPVRISSAEYPVTVSWNIRSATRPTLVVGSKEIMMDARGSVALSGLEKQIAIRTGASVQIPKEFTLSQNYPNPFNPSTVIRYQLPAAAHVRIKVYDIRGQEVATLADGVQEAGYRTVEWNGSGNSSGVYFYKLEAGSFSDTKKMLMLK